MTTTAQPEVQLARVALAVYGARLGTASMQLALDAVQQAGSVEAVMDGLLLHDLGSLDAAQVAARLVDDIGISGGARLNALAAVQARLEGVPTDARGAAVIDILDGLAALTADPNWGIWASRFNTQVAAVLQSPPLHDSYLRPQAEAGHYASWISVTPHPGGEDPLPGGGGTDPPPGGGGVDPLPGGGTDDPPPTGGGSTLDLIAVSDQAAAAIGGDALADEGLDVVLSSTPSIQVRIDANGDGVVGASEITDLTLVMGADNVLTGAANDRLTLTQDQLRVDAHIDLGSQQDNTRPGFLREGGDRLTLVHADIDRNGIVDAADATWRPTLALAVEPGGRAQLVASGGALLAQTARYTLLGVEQLDLQQAATSDRFDDSVDLSALPGATLNLGPARAVGPGAGGGFVDLDRVGRIDANALDAGGIAAQGSTLGLETLTLIGATLIERVLGGAGDERVIVAADAAMQSVGSGAFALSDAPQRTHFDHSLAELGGFSSAPSRWEDQGLYRFDLGAGTTDMLDYHAETAGVTVAVATDGGPDHVYVGSAGSGNGRVDLALGVERYFGAQGGANWIDLAASTLPTTLEFTRWQGSSEIAEPDGDRSAAGLTRGTELRSADGTVLATFVDRTGAGTLAAAEWRWVQGGNAAETVLLGDDELATSHLLQLGGGANRVDHAAAHFAIDAQLGAVDTTLPALPQLSTIAGDLVEQLLGADPQGDSQDDRLTVVGSGAAGDTLLLGALSLGAVVRADPALPTHSQVDPAFHLVDLAAGRVVESLFGEYTPPGSVGQILPRAFGTRVLGFENASNAGDADAVHLLGDGGVNALTGGSADDLLYGGRGSAGGGTADVGAGQRGDRLTGGAGADVFEYRAENESPGGSIAGGQQRGSDFGFNEFMLVNARDTITDFSPGVDHLLFDIDDSADAVRVPGALPASLAGSANAAQPLLALLAPGSVQLDIGRDAGATDPAAHQDNFAIDTPGATLTLADLVLRVRASAGADTLDASAGLTPGPLAAPATDDARVEIVYSAASQSQAAGYDQIVHFRPGSDRIDLSFMQMARSESQHAGNGVAYDGNGNNIVDALETGLVRTLGSAPVFAINSPIDKLFIDAGTWRPLAAATQTAAGGSSLTVFIDADGDGNYAPAVDMVIVLVGIAAITSADVIVDRYGGWG